MLHVIDSSMISNGATELSHVATFNGVFMQKLEAQLQEKYQALKAKNNAEKIPIF